MVLEMLARVLGKCVVEEIAILREIEMTEEGQRERDQSKREEVENLTVSIKKKMTEIRMT